MDSLYDIIQQAKKKSLSSKDVLKLVDNKANLLIYHQLTKYNNIDDALGKYGALILLYETKKNYGHWTLVFKRDKNTIEMFDSYGIFIDDELNFVPKNFKKEGKETYPYLTYLLYNSGYNIEYNDKQLQSKKIGTATCGRWTAVRLLLRYISIEKFIKLFTGNKCFNPDDLVTLITILI